MSCPIFMTKSTKELTRIILKDAFKVGKITHQHLGYGKSDIKGVLDCIKRVQIGSKGNVDGISFEYFDAGHIPGSASVLLKLEGVSLLYTGDINTVDTLLLNGAETAFPEVDIMICESTYGNRDHPQRVKVEAEFVEKINKVLTRGGQVIIPVFALGRSQEIIMLLAKHKFKAQVYFDGMGVEATDIAIRNPDDVADVKALRNALGKVKIVKSDKDRIDAIKGPSIIVTTSGMLTGGPVMVYLKYLCSNPAAAVLLTGYQAAETNGRMLLEKREVYIDGMKRSVMCEIAQFDFSAHAGLAQLKDLVRKVRPKKVFFVHGEEPSTIQLREWASALGMQAFSPTLGEVFEMQEEGWT
jgi:putative mRNA 3-end processing factor